MEIKKTNLKNNCNLTKTGGTKKYMRKQINILKDSECFLEKVSLEGNCMAIGFIKSALTACLHFSTAPSIVSQPLDEDQLQLVDIMAMPKQEK